MEEMERAYYGAAYVYHKYRRDAIALDAAITLREACNGGR
jgi:hypothetical protein